MAAVVTLAVERLLRHDDREALLLRESARWRMSPTT
jgi:hypothetical protein